MNNNWLDIIETKLRLGAKVFNSNDSGSLTLEGEAVFQEAHMEQGKLHITWGDGIKTINNGIYNEKDLGKYLLDHIKQRKESND